MQLFSSKITLRDVFDYQYKVYHNFKPKVNISYILILLLNFAIFYYNFDQLLQLKPTLKKSAYRQTKSLFKFYIKLFYFFCIIYLFLLFCSCSFFCIYLHICFVCATTCTLRRAANFHVHHQSPPPRYLHHHYQQKQLQRVAHIIIIS